MTTTPYFWLGVVCWTIAIVLWIGPGWIIWLMVWPSRRRCKLARRRAEKARREAEYAEARLQEWKV
jgi:uncharacterized membrane protein